jgi:hypothetical protein
MFDSSLPFDPNLQNSKGIVWLMKRQATLTFGQFYKNFFVHNLSIFVMSYSVCPWQAFPPSSNKESSPLRKFVCYGYKTFYNFASWCKSHKKFNECNLWMFRISFSVCPRKAFSRCLIFASKANAYATFQILHSWVGSRPSPQTLDQAVNACQVQTL